MSAISHPNLGPGIQGQDPGVGFFLKDRQPGEVLEVKTTNHTYRILIDNPEDGDIAITSDDQPEFRDGPIWFHLQGSTFGGSMVRVGWIGTGMRMRLNSLTGQRLALLSPTESFRWLEGGEAQKVRDASETTRPRAATPEETERYNSVCREWIDGRPWGEPGDRARKLIAQFSFPNGQVHVATVLETAREAGKLEQALVIMENQLSEHWGYRPPPFRGEILTEIDARYFDRAYRELGLKPPSSE